MSVPASAASSSSRYHSADYAALGFMPRRGRDRRRTTGWSRHKSEAVEEGEQRVGGPVASRSGVWGRGASERALLEREVGVQVDLGRLETLVSEPERDHG